jgi:predicted homoserine dehydrogenase-like protein
MNLSLRGWKLAQPVAAGELVRWADVVVDETHSAVRLRREMEQTCAAQPDMVLT